MSDPASADQRRGLILTILAIAQLMIVVDASIVSIALPSMQRALGISTADRQWVITAYTLAFGGLLLLGGRVADYLGRKRVFIAGLLGFAAASALGGIAEGPAVLFAARAAQGAFAAVMAPAALSLVSVTFTNTQERARALGVFAAIAGSGLALGLILGGVLVEYASWRWCLIINTPIAIITAIAAQRVLQESRAGGDASYDVPGATAATAGLVALVYGLTKAGQDGWGSAQTVAFLGVAAVLLVTFVEIERRVANPLLPLRIVTERNRGGAFLTSALINGGVFGMFVFLSYYLQSTRHDSAIATGLAVLPFSVGIVVSASVSSILVPRIAPRILMTGGLAVSTLGFVLLAHLGVGGAYASHVLPGLVIMSLGLGLVFVPINNVSLFGIDPDDAGIASAVVNATQQVGGSIGTALMNTVAISTSAGYLSDHRGVIAVAKAAVKGDDAAFWIAAALTAASLMAALLINARAQDVPADQTAVETSPASTPTA